MKDRRGLEVSTLVTVIIIVVFILVALLAIYAMWQAADPSRAGGGLCSVLPGFFGGC